MNELFCGFRPSSSESQDPNNSPYLAVAAEVKVLMLAPEKIWACVDKKDFMTAAQLYLFSRHIHTSLTLTSEESEIVSTYFPVVTRQWAAIAHFDEAVQRGCGRVMAKGSSPSEVIAAMTSMAWLKEWTTEKLFQDLLSKRKIALEKELRQSKAKETAKAIIGRSLEVIMSTMEVVHQAFVNKGDGDLLSILEENYHPTLGLFETRSSPVFKHLPKLISEFCPYPVVPLKELSNEFVEKETLKWLDEVHDVINKETTDLLEHVSSLQALAGIRKACYDLLMSPQSGLTPEKWNQLCTEVIGKELNLWDEFYRGLFRERAEALVKTQIMGFVYFVQAKLAQDNSYESETDLSEYLWSESNLNEVTSIPKFEIQSQSLRFSKPTSLELKAHGYSPQVQEMCSQVDAMLDTLIKDISVFIKGSKDQDHKESLLLFSEPETNKVVEPFELTADNGPILQSVQEVAMQQTKEMVSYIAKKHVDVEAVERKPGLLLFLGRLYQAFPELCSNLQQCVLAPQALVEHSDLSSISMLQQRRIIGGSKNDPNWSEIKKLFDEESIRLFTFWVKSLGQTLEKTLLSFLSTTEIAKLMKIFPTWNVIEIMEETEEGAKVKSQIQVPQHPSVALSFAIAEYCSTIYKVAPYSFPVSIQALISQEASRVICQVYEDISQRKTIPQRVSLQLHFDLSFVNQCMITRDNKELSQKVQSVISAFELHVDPFDLSVFTPYMSANVKKSILRQHGLFSILIPSDRFTLLASMRSSLPTTSGSQSEQQHNVLWSFTHKADKMPVIPVPRKKKRRPRETAAEGAMLSTMSTSTLTTVSPVMGRRKKRDKSPVSRAAGSFFEAMSSSWFGGGKS